MQATTELLDRCQSKCELCSADEGLQAYIVPPKAGDDLSEQVALCPTCLEQIEDPTQIDANHWRCLNDSMWNENPAVQVMAFRMLHQLQDEEWAQGLLGMIYMDEHTRTWAEIGVVEDENAIVHKDSNGHILQAGDSVVLIQDLNVKGANFTAKRGTPVRRISLVPDNAEQIEGRVNDQHIVILTKFVKKTS
jgi:protein PhnA